MPGFLLWVAHNWRLALLLAFAALMGAAGLRWQALNRQVEIQRRRADELEAYRQFRREGDRIARDVGQTPDDARQWLRERNNQKDSRE